MTIYRLHRFICACSLVATACIVQAQQNPFDQQYKLAQPLVTEQDTTPVDPATSPFPVFSDPVNPSELNETSGSMDDGSQDTLSGTAILTDTPALSDPHDQALIDGEERRGKNLSLILFLILTGATLLTTLTISSNKSLVNNIFRGVLNDNYLNLLYREHKKSGSIHYYLLYFVFVINAGLLAYFMFQKLGTALSPGPSLWQCTGLVGVIYIIKHLFLSYLSEVYPFQKEVEQYAFTILIFNIFIGLLLLPINAFIAFSPAPISLFFLYCGGIFFLISYVFRQLRGLFIGSRFLLTYKFYFLLYLCAFEIAPILLLFKVSGV